MKKNIQETVVEERQPVKAAGTYTYEKTERKRVAEQTGNALPLRIGAVLCWSMALIFEAAAILFFIGKSGWFEGKSVWMIVASLVLDLVFVISGSALWKKGNRMQPVSEKKKSAFFIVNNLGIFAASLAFWPFVLVALSDKRAAKKTKLISLALSLIAIAAEIIAAFCK